MSVSRISLQKTLASMLVDHTLDATETQQILKAVKTGGTVSTKVHGDLEKLLSRQDVTLEPAAKKALQRFLGIPAAAPGGPATGGVRGQWNLQAPARAQARRSRAPGLQSP